MQQNEQRRSHEHYDTIRLPISTDANVYKVLHISFDVDFVIYANFRVQQGSGNGFSGSIPGL